MAITLIAVVEDGGGLVDETLPADTRRVLAFQAGETVELRVRLVYRSGAPVIMQAGDSLTITARTVGTPASRVLFRKSSALREADLQPGWYRITLVPGDTGWLDVRRALWDLQYRAAAGASYAAIQTSTLVMSASVGAPSGTPPDPVDL